MDTLGTVNVDGKTYVIVDMEAFKRSNQILSRINQVLDVFKVMDFSGMWTRAKKPTNGRKFLKAVDELASENHIFSVVAMDKPKLRKGVSTPRYKRRNRARTHS